MLKSGRYISECTMDYIHQYKIILDVKESEKSYIFMLIECNSIYDADHIKMMFKNANQIVIKKSNCTHAIIKYSDSDFTIYPYRLGVPFYFRLVS